ncbi:SoxR reducing system RseC family protein [Abyssisolibacter fermentans]|uniref:SoxR reducing system RseC family protein n=1 Tax=Abyssisolibacter fermentans TaxID=1766203 RepID=UPI0008355204|nr:SoxR reducing system RseC family protein [Abyssisolibacter fermentans]
MKQIGHVFDVNDDFAIIDVRRVSACGHNCADCGGSCDVPAIRVKIKNILNAKQGDYVEIKTESKKILKYAFIVYLIPMILMLSAIAVSAYFLKKSGYSNYESYSMLIGLLFLGLSYFILKYIDKKAADKIEFKMIEIIGHIS